MSLPQSQIVDLLSKENLHNITNVLDVRLAN